MVTAGTGTALTLPPQPAIPMGAVGAVTCTPQSITLTFTDAINCNTVAPNGSDFIITGPSAVTVASATAVNCNASGETNTITLQFAAPILITGNYQVQAAAGTDGNTLLGACGRMVTAGDNAAFTLPPQPALAMGTVGTVPCTPQNITLTFADPIFCNSVAADGSDFLVTGPSTVAVTSATAVNCNANGETNTIRLQFLVPILPTGNYQVTIAVGSDGNTLIGSCGRQVAAGTSTPFILPVQPPLPMGTVIQPGCAPSTIVVDFPENFNCFSIAANGSDFQITGPSPVTITSAAGQCNINPLDRTITLTLANPITTSGTYQVEMVVGSDGNSLLGNCNNSITIGATANFDIPASPPVAMDSIVPLTCAATTIRLIFDEPIRCLSVANDGSDFSITGPNPVTILSASGLCNANALVTVVEIQLSSPIVNGGLYTLQLQAGSDGNTLLSECYRPTPPSSLVFAAADTVSAVFQYQVAYDCETDTLSFTHPGLNNVNEWAWTVNGTSASTQQNFTQNFSASSQNTVQLVVSNGLCTDTYSESIILNNRVTAAIAGPDVFCPEDTIVFVDESTGAIDTWSWNFGNGNTSSLQVPPSQVYPLTGTETIYPVSLTVSNNTGCQTTATKNVRVLGGCIIAVPTAFTPNNDGLNDHFYPLNGIKAENLDFKVFNRWGQLLFHSRDWTKKWDGTVNGIPQATNVYIWTLNYTHRDTRVKYSLKGTVTLIR
jgi:gliding motility-associated-like protein